jgi:hypothetical protein
MSFQQSPPSLGNQYEDDRVLRSYLARVLPETMLLEIEASTAAARRSANSGIDILVNHDPNDARALVL